LGLTALRGFLRRHRRIALDASVFIYQLEANSLYLGLTDPVFAWLERPEHTAVTSIITMTELLVPAYRRGGEQRVNEFYALLTTLPESGLDRAESRNSG
jgi:hypothetical protein